MRSQLDGERERATKSEREREREREFVCVCEREKKKKERENQERIPKDVPLTLPKFSTSLPDKKLGVIDF